MGSKQELTIDYEDRKLVDCENTVHVHGRAVPAKRPSPHLRSMERKLVSRYLKSAHP